VPATSAPRPSAPDRAPPARLAICAVVAASLAIAAPSRGEFVDATASSGIDIADHTFGLGWGDFDGDASSDLLVVRHFYRPIIFQNVGSGSLSFSLFPPLFGPSDHHGPLVADFDGDGDLDVYFTSGSDAGMGSVPKRLYRNDGPDIDEGVVFRDIAIESGLADSLGRGRSSSAMDVDGDGALDIFVAKAPRDVSPNSLFMNDGAGHFTDVAAAAGIADPFGSVGGIWGDYDRDGDPDLLIGGEESNTYETRLYRNDGNVQFTDVTAQLLPSIGPIACADWGDYDQDGDLDLAAGRGDEAYFDALVWDADSLTFFFNARGNDNGLDGFAFVQSADSTRFDLYTNGFYQPSTIYIGEKALHPGPVSPFTLGSEIEGAPIIEPGETVGIYLWTTGAFGLWQVRCNAPPGAGYTFSGLLTTNGDFLDAGTTELEPYSHGPRGTRIFRNDGAVFTDVTFFAGITDSVNARQIAWVDYDLDGRLDLFVMNKGDTEVQNQPDLLYRNNGGGHFTDVTAAEHLVGPEEGIGDAFAFGDADGDGDLDLAMLSGAGPRFFSVRAKYKLYENVGPTGGSLRVELEGTLSTKDGYGAWVTCVSETAGRQVHYVTGNAWRGGPVPREPLFGLRADRFVDTLRVEWPSSAITVLTDVPPGVVVVNEVDPATGAPPAPAGARFAIDARPNPASGAMSFSIEGRGEGPARVSIYDTAGRRIAVRSCAPGEKFASWDGRTEEGGRAASGVYFAKVVEGERRAVARFVLLH
jgi:hypothetical protein